MFWPTIACFGIPYNLLVLSKVSGDRAAELATEFGDAWTDDMDAAVAKGLSYEINVRILEQVAAMAPPDVRFTPGSITLLTQHAQTKALTPETIKLYAADGTQRVYSKGDNAWIYALQAAKTSITVWGIWIGHVGHWHIPTAAMQMAMYNALPASPVMHPLWTLLQPQSQSLIDFDYVLLERPGVWETISPPTPVADPTKLLDLLESYYSAGADFFDQDPANQLANQGIAASDFTVDPKKPWDAWPVAGYLLGIWDFCEKFIDPVVKALYGGDGAVAGDKGLQAWLSAARDPEQGNVQLEPILTRDKLTELLTSLLYRVTAHAAGSMTTVVNPTLAFISNFPPCLQSTAMPQPGDSLSDTELLKRMPYTGTMGGMATFYFTFAYSLPTVPAIPFGGDQADLYWPVPGSPADQTCNAALVKYRVGIRGFVKQYTANWNEILASIAGVTTRTVPAYAEHQAEQWPRSIEI
jgi:hypothetical protein